MKGIRYKVVTKDRKSVLRLFEGFHQMQRSKYILTYEKGAIVEADKNTLGIFTFQTRKQAEEFKYYYLETPYLYAIIKVKPLDKRGKVPEKVSYWLMPGALGQFYGTSHLPKLCPPVEGTICYRAVEVLS